MKKILLTLLIAVYGFSLSYSQTSNDQNRNYVRESTYQQSGAVSSEDYSNPTKIQHKVMYFDGLGRPIQTILPYMGGNLQDIVSSITYDVFGRQSQNYLPYPVVDGKGSYSSNYSSLSTSFYGNNRPFSQSIYESSPLNRVVKQANPDHNWSLVTTPSDYTDNTVKTKYSTNSADEVKHFRATGINGTAFVSNGNYSIGSLSVVESLDENNTSGTGGNRTKTYTDRSGKVILKRVYESDAVVLDTYYVYDDLGQLRMVFPPKLTKIINDNSGDINSAILQLGFVYGYDKIGRMINKKVPDAGQVTLSYNNKDLVTSEIDGRDKKKYYQYDGLNRLIVMGMEDNYGNQEWLVRNFYDGDRPTNTVKVEDVYDVKVRNDKQEKGLLTGVSTRVLRENGTYGDALFSTNHYDARGQVVRTYQDSYSGDRIVSEDIKLKLHYTGRVLEKTVVHTTPLLSEVTTIETYTYDHAGRLKSICHKLSDKDLTNNQVYTEIPRVLNCLSYDGIGRLVNKKVGRFTNAVLAGLSGKDYVESLNYSYNVRGALTGIVGYSKPDFNTWATGSQNFNFSLSYAPSFGSNIQSTSWNSDPRTYTYDGLSRLRSSTGANREELEYDRNGNITKLKRWLNNTMVDDLTYNYNGVGNQLGSVTDYSSGSDGFKTGSSNGFSYDGNGNMTADNSKNINVSYNDLNLVRQVTGGVPTQNYLYGGDGQKLAQHNGTQWKNYLGAGEYVAGKIYRMATAEGYIVPNTSYTAGSSTGKYSYYYNLSDHLGNIRIVIGDDANATQIQTNDYTPFGLAISSDVSKNKYLYNGKELQDGTNWLDYGARMYYPELGRFFNVDRFSEKYYDFTPYHYAANNPIRFIDVNGDSLWVNTGETGDDFALSWRYTEDKGYGLYNSKGEIYAGNNKFVKAISDALSKLNLSSEGNSYLNMVSSSAKSVRVSETSGRNVTGGDIVYVNPNLTGINIPTEKGNIESPFYITLGHELAHGYANSTGNQFQDWVTIKTSSGDKSISTSEIYATHIENIFRSSNYLPLRTHYSPTNDGSVVEETRIIDNGASLFYSTGQRSPSQIYLEGLKSIERFNYKKP